MTDRIEPLEERELKKRMREYAGQDLVVAFSGGVDSSLLLYLARLYAEESGSTVHAVVMHTMLQTEEEVEEARKTAMEMGAIPWVLRVDEWENAGILDNPRDRCYLCKRYLFSKLKSKAEQLGASVILEGTNQDDLHTYRPGIRAIRELGIKSPLAEAGMTKEAVRSLAESYGITTAKKPSAPCLATRFPYGTRLTREKLARVEQGESYLRKFGGRNVRLRIHGDIARIEVDETHVSDLLSRRLEIAEYLKELGYLYVTLDLQGFRSGSMDEELLERENRKITVVVDSLKGSLTSMEAGSAIAEGIRRINGNLQVEVRPLADGGEGTVDALVTGLKGQIQEVSVTGPLQDMVPCRYGIIGETGTAVIEIAGAAGITLVPKKQRNPLETTTYGVGEVIRDAILKGCRRFLIGIGGSATNDGGAGMLQALGFGLLDENGEQIPLGAKGLEKLRAITDDHVLPELAECEFRIACDVTNVLCGSQGCSAVYGPQKGATPSMISQMDQWLGDYAALARVTYPKANPLQPGAGAAGGLGFAFLTFTNAVLESGVKMILEETKLEECIREADLVITGEGCLDGQTAMGKAPVGVAQLAKRYGKTVVALAGSVAKGASVCNQKGIDAFFPILQKPETLEKAMEPEEAKGNLADTAEQVIRLWMEGRIAKEGNQR